MAIKEVRLYIYSNDKKREGELAGELWMAFKILVDGVMRGRYKEFSGNEVKGINIVNIELFDNDIYLKMTDEMTRGKWRHLKGVNVCSYEMAFDSRKLIKGKTVEKLKILVDVAIKCMKECDLVQVVGIAKILNERSKYLDFDKAVVDASEYKKNMGNLA